MMKYFALAGLEVSVMAEDAPGASIGLNMQTRDGKLVVAGATTGSESEAAGLVAGDQIADVNGVAATPKALNDMLAAGKEERLHVIHGLFFRAWFVLS